MSFQAIVDDEVNGRQIPLMLTAEQYERAQRDAEYVQQLILEFDTNTGSIPAADTRSMTENEDTEQRLSGDQASKSLFIWNEACIFLLLTLYEEYKEDFERKRHKLVFENIARKMREVNTNYNVNGSQCQSKINSLKKHYKKIVDHNATSGNDRAAWPYFDRMNEIFGSSGWANPIALASEIGPSPDEIAVTPEPRRRKLDCVLEDYRKDIKKFREERARIKQDNFNKYLEMKERQHKEKMQLLQSLCNNNNVY